MSFKTFEYKIKIVEHHLDTFGHMNNATYLALYEEARWDFITQNGYGLEEIQKELKGPVILDVSCRYKREIKNRETITIVSHTKEMKGKIGQIYQEMIKEDGTVASDATFTVGFMDMKLRKLISPTEAWLKAVGQE
ncbi:MAG: acyl-CoA thioesterase [Bdellovibrionota bacterium]|nr:acyl-CoA thioesterase [Bdellovibrionota bacterium]